MTFSLTISSSKSKELIDIADRLEHVILDVKIKEEPIIVFARHTTCSPIISELEDNFADDFVNYLTREGPKGPFRHSHGNLKVHSPKHTPVSHTPARLLSAKIGQSVQVPIENFRLALGTWQRICLLGLDGPRQRNIIVKIIS